ncbi:MAG: glucose 1-dehydrogenase [Porticoccaceae bacterium]|nr:glucose 1-dehydrogenase [Porticoccaceae bacterium]
MTITQITSGGLRLENKVAIVTGAGSGLGRASALHFAKQGAKVACVDIDIDAATETAALIAAIGGSAEALWADTASPEANDNMVAKTLEHYRRIDILFANAGIPHAGSVTSTSVEDWNRVIAVNLTGVWLSNRAVLPTMIAQGGGSIINQSSISALAGFSGVAAYTAAKGGVVALTRQAAVEYAEQNVRINAICPGTVHTPLVTATYEQRGGAEMGKPLPLGEALAVTAAKYPLKRIGTVDDIAQMAVFLGSDESRWITGAIFPVDGGYTAA